MGENKVVFTTGCFDLFHIGHLQFLEQARALGDRLVVGVQDDEVIIEAKGHSPIYPLYDRLRLVSALSCVDVAFPIHGAEDEIGITLCGARIRAIGPDHGYLARHQPTREKLEAAGIEYITIPRTPGVSTSIIRRKCHEEVSSDNVAGVASALYGLYIPEHK